jgi:DNA-binding beta-propeller fold protein YncE
MPKRRPCLFRRLTLTWVLTSLLASTLPSPLHAGKKKDATPPPPVSVGDQRTKAYFDISKIVWPNPPAIPRVAFKDLFTGQKIDSSLFIKKAKKATWMDRLAGTQSADEVKTDNLPFQLQRTYGVAVDSKGAIYAVDQAVGAVFVFDAEKRDHVELIGNGRQANFGLIVDVALDDDDRVFVSDAKVHHVLVFNAKHEQIGSFGAGVLVRPGGMAIDHQNRFVYVADAGNDVVDVFDSDSFKLLRQIGKPSRKHDQTDPGTFSLPEAVAVDNDGNVYVTDTFNNRVEIFDADGEFISTFGKNGDGPADLERPKGIAIDCDGHIWVVDAAQNVVKVFNPQGRLLIYFGGEGNYPGQFMGPWGIAIDKSNRVIVSETFPGRVQLFRYITDAQAAAEKGRREGATQHRTSAPISNRQDTSSANSSGATSAEIQPAPETSQARSNLAARNQSPVQQHRNEFQLSRDSENRSTGQNPERQ